MDSGCLEYRGQVGKCFELFGLLSLMLWMGFRWDGKEMFRGGGRVYIEDWRDWRDWTCMQSMAMVIDVTMTVGRCECDYGVIIDRTLRHTKSQLSLTAVSMSVVEKL